MNLHSTDALPFLTIACYLTSSQVMLPHAPGAPEPRPVAHKHSVSGARPVMSSVIVILVDSCVSLVPSVATAKPDWITVPLPSATGVPACVLVPEALLYEIEPAADAV